MSSTSLHLKLTFPSERVREPVVYELVKRFDVVPNIRRAAIDHHMGWMVIELQGEPDALADARDYLTSLGVDVASAEGDVVTG